MRGRAGDDRNVAVGRVVVAADPQVQVCDGRRRRARCAGGERRGVVDVDVGDAAEASARRRVARYRR